MLGLIVALASEFMLFGAFFTAFFYMGELIEHAETDLLFTKPSNAKTEDYITGRFG